MGAKKQKRSTNDRHPYMRGYRFWVDNQFWNSGVHSERSREYFNNSLAEMQQRDKPTSL